MNAALDLSRFIQKHKLPESYKLIAEKWFLPMAEEILSIRKKQAGPLVIGINGSQGSGKSTLADLLQYVLQSLHATSVVSLSIDDFYLTRKERESLAENIHPLLITRGVPGTHDIKLALKTMADLKSSNAPVAIPRFDKSQDDRTPQSQWQSVNAPLDIIILEGWCVGSSAQPENQLTTSVNALESNEDAEGTWRHYANQQLQENYPALFSQVDIWIMLKAPSFECVFDWRLEQEEKLSQALKQQEQTQEQDQPASGIMSPQEIARFIQHYQRITEHTLINLPVQVHFLFELDKHRQITRLSHPVALDSVRTGLMQSFSADTRLLIFTDMDGSLLDHHDYSHADADSLLAELESKNIPVIPATSKTSAELIKLRDELVNAHPFIAENGAAVYIPEGYFADKPENTIHENGFHIKTFSQNRQHWQKLIASLQDEFGDSFTTFAQAGIEGIQQMTGLDKASAALAAQREYGEPVAWQGTEKDRLSFIAQLEQQGAKVLQGGRFMHVSGQCNKGQALQWLAERYQAEKPGIHFTTLAIGDSQNDVAMLEAADMAIVIRSPAHDMPKINQQTNCYQTTCYGPKGWAEGVKNILAFINK